MQQTEAPLLLYRNPPVYYLDIFKTSNSRPVFCFGLYFASSERKMSYKPRMASGWVNHGLILIFGWTIPLN